MKIKEFELERYFAKYEFATEHLISCSDCDGYSLDYILNLATPEERSLWDNQTFGYTESNGHPVLRQRIADQYQTIDTDQLIVLSPGEANYGLMTTLLTADDHVICVCPAYQSLYEIVNSIGSELSFWKPDPHDWTFDVNELESLIRSNTKLIVINFPHNPTGSYLTSSQLEGIVEVSRKNDIHLFSDEMYAELVPSTDELLPAVCDIYDKGVSLWGMSKSFGLAGLRLGWLATKDATVLKKVQSIKDYLTICNGTSSEILSMIALRNKEHFIQPNINKIKRNLKVLRSFVARNSDHFTFAEPRAGSTALLELNKINDVNLFCEKMVTDSKIMAVPSSMFNYRNKYIRIGLGRTNFPEVLAKFEQYYFSAI